MLVSQNFCCPEYRKHLKRGFFYFSCRQNLFQKFFLPKRFFRVLFPAICETKFSGFLLWKCKSSLLLRKFNKFFVSFPLIKYKKIFLSRKYKNFFNIKFFNFLILKFHFSGSIRHFLGWIFLFFQASAEKFHFPKCKDL